jgi:hypothetical protein
VTIEVTTVSKTKAIENLTKENEELREQIAGQRK